MVPESSIIHFCEDYKTLEPTEGRQTPDTNVIQGETQTSVL